MTFSRKFRDWLANLIASGAYGTTQSEIACRLGISQGYLSKLQSGAAKGQIRVDQLERFAQHLGYSVEDLVWAVSHGKDLPPRRHP